MPIYKSYADPLVLHFINYFSDLELGFTFGNYEDSPKIGFVDRLLKRIGTFLMRRFPSNHAVAEKGEGKLHHLRLLVENCILVGEALRQLKAAPASAFDSAPRQLIWESVLKLPLT